MSGRRQLLALVLATVALAACGRRGDLRLPDRPTPPDQASPPDDDA